MSLHIAVYFIYNHKKRTKNTPRKGYLICRFYETKCSLQPLEMSVLYFGNITMYVSFSHRSLRRGVHSLNKCVRTIRAFQTGANRSAKQESGTLRE